MWYILCGLIGLVVTGPAVYAGQVGVDSTLIELKKDARVFERIVTEVLRQNFENPFAIAADPQAAYLPGYGVVISFQLKLNRSTIRGFSGDILNPSVSDGRTTEEQIELVRQTVIRSLADYASTLKHLRSDERVAICAHIEDRNELDPLKKRTDIVGSSTKGDIDDYVTRKINLDEFKRRVQLLEY